MQGARAALGVRTWFWRSYSSRIFADRAALPNPFVWNFLIFYFLAQKNEEEEVICHKKR